MPASECRLPFSTGGLVGEYGQWTVPSYTNEQNINGSAGKRAVVRAGGSASRAAGDQSSTDPGGGFCRNKQRKSNWRLPTEHSKRGLLGGRYSGVSVLGNTGGRPRDGLTEFDRTAPEEEIVSHPLEHSGVVEWAGVSNGLRERSPPESFEICTDPAPVWKAVEEEPLEHSVPSGTPSRGSEPLNTAVQEETEEGEAIIVGAVGSAAPWFLTGWTNEVEVEFMIDTGCQVTILATSVFEKMYTAHPQVRSRIRPCA